MYSCIEDAEKLRWHKIGPYVLVVGCCTARVAGSAGLAASLVVPCQVCTPRERGRWAGWRWLRCSMAALCPLPAGTQRRLQDVAAALRGAPSGGADDGELSGESEPGRDYFRRVRVAPGVELRVVVDGAGPLVVLLHGFPQGWYLWRHTIQPLVDAGFRVAAPDQRGYGAPH